MHRHVITQEEAQILRLPLSRCLAPQLLPGKAVVYFTTLIVLVVPSV